MQAKYRSDGEAEARKPDEEPKLGGVDNGPGGGDETAGEDRQTSIDSEAMPLADWIVAETHSRPVLPDENADGLDAMDAEIQRQAEDR